MRIETFVGVAQTAFRFGIVGALASAVHLAVASAAIAAGVQIVFANSIGFCVALGVSLLGHHTISFPKRTAFWRGARRFIPVAIIGFIANNAVLATLVAATGNSLAWLKVAMAILVILPVTFGYAYFFAYKD